MCVCVCVCVSARVFFFFFNPLIYCWNWSCFHIIILNNTSMNTGCMYLFKLAFSFSGAEFSFPGAELLDFYGSPIFNFWDPFILFSTLAVQIYFPTNSELSSLFSTFSPTFAILSLSDDNSDRYEVSSKFFAFYW